MTTTTNDSPGLLGWLLALVWVLLRWLVRHPVVCWTLALTLTALYLAGSLGVVLLWAGIAAGALLWRTCWPDSWNTCAVARLRASWRDMTVYAWRWPLTMSRTGLAKKVDGERLIPRKVGVRSPSVWYDIVTAQLLPGVAPEAWETLSPELAASFGAEACTVHRVNPERHRVELIFRHGDPLKDTLPPLDPIPAEDLDLEAVPIGRSEWGDPWTVPLLGTHVLCAGETGSGKGSVIGSAVTALAPAVAEGVVELWGCDPKGGVELSLYESMFTRLAWDHEDMVSLLEDLVSEMNTRLVSIRGKTRKVTPSTEHPLKVAVIDEFASLIAYMPDKKLRERAEAACGQLLSKGRAPGVSVVALVQDPRKETVPFRDLFPTRIANRLAEGDIVDAVLGDGAYRRGARCDLISPATPGVGYVVQEGDPTPLRVRATWCDDDHLRQLAHDYPAPELVKVHPNGSNGHDHGSAPAPVIFDDDDTDDTAVWVA